MKKKRILILAIVFIILVLIGILAFKIISDKKTMPTTQTQESAKEEETQEQEQQEPEPEKKEIKIFKGEDRPIAVMIDNHKGAWPQAGLNKTYMVYEIIVEGGETRLMALFKGKDIKEIGPVRSSRHYFLDYALENDAIYVHYGWSPQAKRDISKLSVNNINGITYGQSKFWRVRTKSAPHNVLTSTSAILSIAKDKGYKTTSNAESVLNYVDTEVTLENGTTANEVTIPYSTLHTVKYKYNKKTKKYTRYARGVRQTEYSTKKDVTTKNIIIEFVNNSTLSDGSGKGRQTISNINTHDGYYITNGKAIKIKCTKLSRTAKTVYKDLNGNVIEVNDGNTWVNICPKNAKVKIKE